MTPAETRGVDAGQMGAESRLTPAGIGGYRCRPIGGCEQGAGCLSHTGELPPYPDRDQGTSNLL